MKVVISIILFLIIVSFLIGIKIAAKKYKEELQTIKKQEYVAYKYLPLGLLIIDINPKWLDKKTNYNILQIYGKKDYSKRLRYHEAEKITLGVLVVLIALLVSFILSIKQVSSINNQSLVRPNYGEGDQQYIYTYELALGDDTKTKTIDIIVPELKPNETQANEVLQQVAHELPTMILGENTSLDYVNQPLNLPKKYKNTAILLDWKSNDTSLLLDTGEIRYNNLSHNGDRVQLEVTLTYYDYSYHKSLDLMLYNKVLTSQEKINYAIEQIESNLSRKHLDDNNIQSITLLESIEPYDIKVKWYKGDRGIQIISIIIGGLCIGLAFYFLKEYEIRKLLAQRNMLLLLELPNLINKITLLVNAGMTFNRAWYKIATDYRKSIKKSGQPSILYEEMLITIQDMEKGMSELNAYTLFGERCKIPEILRFTSIVTQNIKKGSDMLVNVLQQQSKEAWLIRQDFAKRKGEKASTKLILPMGIMFIAIIMIVMTPAVITLKL